MKKRSGLKIEQLVLVVGIFLFLVFLWIVGFLFLPILRNPPVPPEPAPVIVAVTDTPGFVLPPTWTPAPSQEVIPTPVGTAVVLGPPTRIYTPRPTSLPGLPLPNFPRRLSVIDLARIMQGESPGDLEAAYMVGWVAKNRLLHYSYGDTYAVVSSGFFGYRTDIQLREEFLDTARRVIRAREDPTDGSLYALSRTDITKLGIPPSRADVAYGEWFFFKSWPLTAR